MPPEPGFRIAPNWSWIGKLTMALQFVDVRSSSFFFLCVWCCRVSFVKFSYRIRFNINIITGSGVLTIFVYTGLTKNAEIGNTPVCVLPNICSLEQVRDTKFGTDVSNEKLLNAAKCDGDSFYCFLVIKWKPTGGE